MARFIVEFDTDNAAFAGENLSAEVHRLLLGVAQDVAPDGVQPLREGEGDRGRLRDANGNDVGFWRFRP